MNTNKPTWNEGEKAGSLRDYTAWLNDNARTMFLEDHAHMEIFFLLREDGNAATIPVPVDQEREQIIQSITTQVKQEDIYGVIHIAQLITTIPEQGEAQVEAVIITAESKDGNNTMFVNEIVETETELTLAEEQVFETTNDRASSVFFA